MSRRTGERARRDKGFSLLELIVVLAIITMLAVMLSSRLGNIVGGASDTCALEEMNNIKNAITDMFYPDLGRVPEDLGVDGLPNTGDERPWYAVRYLCFRDDRGDVADDPKPGNGNDPECYDMWKFLGGDASAKAMLIWDRYKQKGWRGPYMGQDTTVEFDPGGTENPGEVSSFPLIATPWADKCEKLAREEEEQGRYALAEECRRGKFYLIVMDRKDDNPIVDTARIISFGANCCDDGSYYKDYQEDEPKIFAELSDLRKQNIDEPDNQNCYFTGDDLVVFLFGGGPTRKPGVD